MMLTQEYLKSILNYNPYTGEFVWLNKTSKMSRISVGQRAGRENGL